MMVCRLYNAKPLSEPMLTDFQRDHQKSCSSIKFPWFKYFIQRNTFHWSTVPLQFFFNFFVWSMAHVSGLVQERRNSIANALELRFSCTNPLMSASTYPPSNHPQNFHSSLFRQIIQTIYVWLWIYAYCMRLQEWFNFRPWWPNNVTLVMPNVSTMLA